ncbi:MAG: gfo/Idh/MocA family oxidoreductase [Planctomycetota bacterium]|nr:MAG: gfo/Idh/MocA family oxidoreductase [Planctomycetota bacterium]REJ93858.1 MAG: gfo/Idh/MocA family oxidoreductase [Planctomycetota bacterium]REK24754.1 MAG: gfo/Idh/MocA family oxidoreductase [Planctomycetota bacterium]REK37808.1 MAG: gfo/Idh/MocA family oxidoreductase [Planctomycetota bacterium]
MTVRIGIIGVGFMGMTHFEGAKDLTGGRVAAIATRSEKKRNGDWSDIQGNFGPPGSSSVNLSEVETYADYRDLLASDEIDLVDICLPTDQHEAVAMEALAAGKHVLVEKPIAIELDAADRMVAAAADAGRLLMVAHVLPFFPEFRWAREAIESGEYGALRAASFRRVITPPTWSKDMNDFRKLGGWGIDLHIHDNHYISLVCGVPQSVFSRGILMDGLVNHVSTQYVYGDAEKTVSCISGGIAAGGLKFAQSFELFLEKATLQFDVGTYGSDWVVNRPLTVITDDDNIETPAPGGRSEWCGAFTDELQEAVDAVASGNQPPTLNGQLARDALKLCHAEAESIARGTPVAVT